jgi:circadian clock protein KaiC
MKISSGLKRLDDKLGGGFPDKTNILVSGGPGTGKTLLGLRFLAEGIKANERCCFVSLNEDKEELLRAADGIDSLKVIRDRTGKNCAIEHITLGENITMKKFNDIISSYPKISRLVIDNINKLLIFSENERSYRINMTELLQQLKAVSNCTLLICETKNEEIDTGNGEAFECDGVIHLSFLDLEEKPMRALQVHKLRYTSFEPKIPHEFLISSKDVKLTNTKII